MDVELEGCRQYDLSEFSFISDTAQSRLLSATACKIVKYYSNNNNCNRMFTVVHIRSFNRSYMREIRSQNCSKLQDHQPDLQQTGGFLN